MYLHVEGSSTLRWIQQLEATFLHPRRLRRWAIQYLQLFFVSAGPHRHHRQDPASSVFTCASVTSITAAYTSPIPYFPCVLQAAVQQAAASSSIFGGGQKNVPSPGVYRTSGCGLLEA
ncbi:hypothetical protein L914_08657 [Phytophthora nicotianae]|uniref:Uncharacterized protein n=1 Tax=Phytophthora nicotianae TaxID=4792 RepID=W2NEU3_PHYNI|nr:hypothetical protein L914_08657 [Phytophthora nicotianae]